MTPIIISTGRRALVVAGGAWVLASATGRARASDAAPADPLQARLDELVSTYSLEGLRLQLQADGQPTSEMVAGSARAHESVAIASLSKSITAMAVAVLIQQGKLSLDTRLDQILTAYYRDHGRDLDASMNAVTVERLLGHRAGLIQNKTSDPEHGLSSGEVIQKLGGRRHFFDFNYYANSDRSNGSEEYHYSNISYLMLGMVVEAASGVPYADFCKAQLFDPLGVADADIPSDFRIVAPYAGWHMPLASVVRLWSVFDQRQPSVLSASTLAATLLAPLGPPRDAAGHVHYTLGVSVRRDTPDGPYVVNHNGIEDFMQRSSHTYSFAEKYVPGGMWAVSMTTSNRRYLDGKTRNAVNGDIRSIAAEVLHGK